MVLLLLLALLSLLPVVVVFGVILMEVRILCLFAACLHSIWVVAIGFLSVEL